MTKNLDKDRLHRSALVSRIKTRAHIIGKEQPMKHHQALDMAAGEYGYRNYQAVVTAIKYGRVNSDRLILFCDRCCRQFGHNDEVHESAISPVYQSFKLCWVCLRIEQKTLRRYWRDPSRVTDQLLEWYAAPKMKLFKKLILALCVQKAIRFTQAREIVAIMIGFPDWDAAVSAAQRQRPAPTDDRLMTQFLLRRKRIEERLVEKRRRDILAMHKKVNRARIRIGNRMFEKSSGTMYSRIGLLKTHCVPVNTIATRVVFYPYGRITKG